MMFKLIACLSLICTALCAVCQKATPQQYIEKFKSLAISEMKRTGVPASITLAQGILESESGNSELVLKSNNHFGIKCKSDWTGPSVSHDDDMPGECFRAYAHPDESFRDHSDFLKNSPRYASLFDLEPQDYEGWSIGLKKAGYATNPRYAEILISNIERYNLNQYTIDGLMQGVTAEELQSQREELMKPENIITPYSEPGSVDDLNTIRVNNLKAVRASAGMSLLAIASKFNVRLSRLLEWNELDNDGVLQKSQLIYLTKKHSEGSQETMVVNSSQTLYDIAQSSGLMVASLSQFNNLNKNDIVSAGTLLYLKKDLKPKVVSLSNIGFGNQIAYHTVEPKEGLFTISKKYGITIAQIKEWNQLTSDNIQIGQKLIVAQ